MHCLAFLERISFSTLSRSFLRINQIKLKQQIFKKFFLRKKTQTHNSIFAPEFLFLNLSYKSNWFFSEFVFLSNSDTYVSSLLMLHISTPCSCSIFPPFLYFSLPFPNTYLSSPLTAGVFYWLFIGFCQFINIFPVFNSKWIFQLLSESCTMRNYPCAFLNQWLLCKAKSSFSLPIVFTFPLIPFVLALNFFSQQTPQDKFSPKSPRKEMS